MDAAEVAVPVPVSAVWGTGTAEVERWADGLRADLARLTGQLHRLRAQADAAEQHLVGVGGPARGEDFLPLVDEMLAAARVRVEAVLQQAGGESSNPAVDPVLAVASWRQLRDRARHLAQRTRA